VNILVRRVLRRLEFDIAQHDPQRIGVIGGTALGSMESTTALLTTGNRDAKYILKQCPNIPLAVAASEFGLQGPSFNVAGACASSAHAAMLTHTMLQTKGIDCALVVGFEFPITPPAVAGMEWIGALYRRNAPADRAHDDPAQASRPFSKDRRGLVLGEGAAIVVMTRRSYAIRMNWPILAVLQGGYVNSDAFHVTRISPDNVIRCISSALAAAKCNVDEIECINAHATSTAQGDAAELSALHTVFGDRLKSIPVVANKSQIGHTLGAAAMLALVLCIHGMNTGVVLPTLNYIPDDELPLACISPAAMERRHNTAIVNAFGFGGTNVSVVLQRPVNP
jgi:3-oxoacyl-[acyl-carrier-protein] synthase II